MKAAVFHGPGDIQFEDVADPICGDDDIVLQVAACGICGTDISAYKHPSLFTSPGQVMGHEFSGRVVAVGSDVCGLAVSDRVTAWPCVHCDRCPRCVEGNWNLCERAWGHSISGGEPGAFAEYVRIPHARLDRTVYRLPDNVSWTAGAMVEPLSVGLAAARRASLRPTDTVVVMGLGMIGLSVLQAVRVSGVARAIGVDRSAVRLKQAAELGAEVIDVSVTDVGEFIRTTTGEGPLGSARVDAVFECTGVEACLSLATAMVRVGGRLVLVGLHADVPRVDINSIIVKQLQAHGSFAYLTEFAAALQLLASGRLEADRLVSHTFPLAQTTDGFQTQMDPDGSVKVMINPTASSEEAELANR